ncbi:T9SS type A sorting domain-containing protein [Chitinophaga sp.]|uniref:Ig-like domain-containing protein n=1 Tax=Chitinophaga sp. TaxID=1869181 RepID=UPI002F934E12
MQKFYARKKLLTLQLFVAVLLHMFAQKASAQTYANSQTNGVTGLCLLCGVANPNNAVNANLTDYSQFNITAGLLGVSVSQTLIFPSVSNSGCDSLIIRISSTNNSLSANLFGGITVQTFNGATANPDATVVDSSMVRFLQSNTIAEIILKPNHSFDRVKLTLSSSLVGLLTGLRIFYAYTNPGKPANPQFTVPQQVVCGPQKLIISNHTAGINYRVHLKYNNYTLPQPIDTAFLVVNQDTILTPDIRTYIFAQVNVDIQAVNPFTGCVSDTVHQAYVQGGSAELPQVGADSVTICKGDSTTLYAYTPTTNLTTINWYAAPTGGTILHTGNYFTVAPAITTTYYVTSASECEYPVRQPVKVIVTKLPDPQYSVPQGLVCGSSLLPVYNYLPGYNYNVRVVYSYTGIPLKDTSYVVHHQDTIPVPAFRINTGAQAKVYVQAVDTLSGCKSDSAIMFITLGGTPSLPVVDHDTVTICNGDSVILHADILTSNFPSVLWYSAPAGGTLLHTGDSFTVKPVDTTIYYVTSRGTCENPQRIPVYVNINSCEFRSAKTTAPTTANLILEIYPNPSSGEVRFSNKENLAGSWLLVNDINGKELQRVQLKRQGFRFEGHIKTGIYFLKTITPAGKIYTGKVILGQP